MAIPDEATIELHDSGPDKEDRRRFTLRWRLPTPRMDGFPGREVLVTHRAQEFFSAQWRGFLAEGWQEP